MKKKQNVEIKNQLNKEIKIVLLSLIAIVICGAAIYFFNTQKVQEVSSTNTQPVNLTREFNHKKGPDSAKVKIVEFYDPECEACAGFFPYVKDALARHGNNIQLTTRYALYHGNSGPAAKATEAAAIQGKFWDFQELLFLNQHEWSHKKEPATEYFIKYAKDLDLDISRFKNDMEDPKRMETINIDIEDGKILGVNGTPTIFINGKMLEKINPTYFNERIEEELRK
jgi:protein-disulfide isomerase